MKNRGGKSRYTIPFMNGGKRTAYFLFRFLVFLLTLMALHFKETMLCTAEGGKKWWGNGVKDNNCCAYTRSQNLKTDQKSKNIKLALNGPRRMTLQGIYSARSWIALILGPSHKLII